MKPCKHGNHPFSYCRECCKEMNEQIKKQESYTTVKYDASKTKTIFGADNTETPFGSKNR